MDTKNIKGNKAVILIVALIVLLILLVRWYFIHAPYDFYYYSSPDQTRTITRIEYKPILEGHSTFFVYGRANETVVPSSYIRPVYSGRDGGFVLLVHWQDSICTLVAPFGRFDTVRLAPSFKYEQLSENSPAWKQMEKDTLQGNNLLLTEYKFK